MKQSYQPPTVAIAYAHEVPSGTMMATTTRTHSLPFSMPSRTPGYSTKTDVPGPRRGTADVPSSAAKVNWKRLPARVLDMVLAHHLRDAHLCDPGSGPESGSCLTCYMKDLSSVQLSCRAWFSDAQRILYTRIQIVGRDDPRMLRRWRLSRAARLVRLRSTLRSKPLLAALVKTLHVPDPHIPLYLATDKHDDGHGDGNHHDPNPDYDDYLCTLASVVMACPNLEAFTGFTPFYNHTFDRLTHALSTRPRLRQHVWVIAENDDVRRRSETQLAPGLLDALQVSQFQLYHERWSGHLETLVLCSPGSTGVVEHQLFISVLHSLPALRNLCVSCFDADDFHDGTLLSLPSCVTALRLEECFGVTDTGLTRWAASPVAAGIRRLSLLHQNVTSLLTLAKALACLDRLTKLTVVQTDVAPALTPLDDDGGGPVVVVQPLFASKSLQFLHWDTSPSSSASSSNVPLPSLHSSVASHANETADPGYCRCRCRCSDSSGSSEPTERFAPGGLTANEHLALSISHGGFPALRRLRVPRDTSPPGALQSVCRPIILDDRDLPVGHSGPFPDFPDSDSLRVARLRAQRFARHQAVGPSTELVTELVKNEFNRPILYFDPDVVGRDGNGGLVGWAELLQVREKAKLDLDSRTEKTRGEVRDRRAGGNIEEEEKEDSPETSGLCTGYWKSRQPGRATNTNISTDTDTKTGEVLVVQKYLTTPSSSFSSTTENSSSSLSSSSVPTTKRRSRSWRPYKSSSPTTTRATTNSSRLSLPLSLGGRKASSSKKDVDDESWRTRRHTARPRGDRGGCIGVEDFFGH